MGAKGGAVKKIKMLRKTRREFKKSNISEKYTKLTEWLGRDRDEEYIARLDDLQRKMKKPLCEKFKLVVKE